MDGETMARACRRRARISRRRRATKPRNSKQRIGFELQLAGVRNVKAARALLPDHDNDIEKLKAAEPWLFGEGATMKRWREIAGLGEK